MLKIYDDPDSPLFNPCKVALEPLIFFETHHASIVFANGGAPPPDPPCSFEPCKLASKHMSLVLQTLTASILFANGRAAPKTPPLF